MQRAHTWALVATLVFVCGTVAYAQEEVSPPDGRGVEGGVEVLSSTRSGEAAFYLGYFQQDHMMAFRFGARDETDAIPCSVGVMYEYTVGRTSGRLFMPMLGASFSRLFDCSTDEDYTVRPSPPNHGAIALSGGARLGLFTGQQAAGSLKLLYFVEKLQGHAPSNDRTNRGLLVGMVIHGR